MNKFAGLTSPRTLRTSKAPVRTFSCNHNVCVSRCRSFPKPVRDAIPIAALESVHTRTGTMTAKSFMML